MAYSEQMWQEAKKKCRLSDEDIARAKRLGLNPRSLVKNIPSKSEPWKAPVNVWLREIEEKRQNKYPPAKPGVFHRRAKPYDTSHASRHVGAA